MVARPSGTTRELLVRCGPRTEFLGYGRSSLRTANIFSPSWSNVNENTPRFFHGVSTVSLGQKTCLIHRFLTSIVAAIRRQKCLPDCIISIVALGAYAVGEGTNAAVRKSRIDGGLIDRAGSILVSAVSTSHKDGVICIDDWSVNIGGSIGPVASAGRSSAGRSAAGHLFREQDRVGGPIPEAIRNGQARADACQGIEGGDENVVSIRGRRGVPPLETVESNGETKTAIGVA